MVPAALRGHPALRLAGQAAEYLHMFGSGIRVGTNLFATTFFTLTGFHGVHVTIGIVIRFSSGSVNVTAASTIVASPWPQRSTMWCEIPATLSNS